MSTMRVMQGGLQIMRVDAPDRETATREAWKHAWLSVSDGPVRVDVLHGGRWRNVSALRRVAKEFDAACATLDDRLIEPA